MANPWFDEEFYLADKLAKHNPDEFANVEELKAAIEAAGLTPEQHFQLYGAEEGTSPNALFNVDQYLANKAARDEKSVEQVRADFQAAGLSAWAHFLAYGWEEGVNPSDAFDIEAYFADKAERDETTPEQVKADFKAAGVDPITHATLYAEIEGLEIKPVAGGTSTLTEALAELKAAQEARVEFLEETRDQFVADEVPGITDETELDDVADEIEAQLGAAEDTIGEDWVADVNFGDRTEAVQDALIADKKTALNADLSSAITKASDDVEKLLASANAAKDALVAAHKVKADTATEVRASTAAFEEVNEAVIGDDAITVDEIVVATQTEGVWKVEPEGAGVRKLGELVAAYNADADAEAQITSANATLVKAVEKVYVSEHDAYSAILGEGTIVVTDPNTDDVKVGIHYTVPATVFETKAAADEYEAPAGATPATFTLTLEEADLDGYDSVTVDGEAAAQVTLEAVRDALVAAGWEAVDGEDNVFTSSDATEAPVIAGVAFDDDLEEDVSTPLDAGTFDEAVPADEPIDGVEVVSASLAAAVVAAQNAVKNFDAAVNALEEARELNVGLEEAQAAIDAAFESLEELDVVLLDGTAFTPENDVYLVNLDEDDDATLTEFGAAGEDKIFFGEGFTLVDLDGKDIATESVGNVNDLEIFWEQVGNSVNLYIEKETFGGNATGPEDLVKITLAGVTGSEIADDLGAGFLSLGTAA